MQRFVTVLPPFCKKNVIHEWNLWGLLPSIQVQKAGRLIKTLQNTIGGFGMKKLLAMALITSMLAMPGFALADDNGTGANGSPSGNPEDIAVTSLPAEEEIPVVGEDIIIDEGEFKIVSVEEDTPEEAPVVGEGIEIGEDEAKIVSVEEDAPVMGEEMSEEEAKILSVQSGLANEENTADFQEQSSNNTLLFSGIGAGAIALAAAGGILNKKRKKMCK
jgi:hypothetical protein